MRRIEMTLRLTKEEKHQVEWMAKMKKKTQADIIRDAIAQAARKERIA